MYMFICFEFLMCTFFPILPPLSRSWGLRWAVRYDVCVAITYIWFFFPNHVPHLGSELRAGNAAAHIRALKAHSKGRCPSNRLSLLPPSSFCIPSLQNCTLSLPVSSLNQLLLKTSPASNPWISLDRTSSSFKSR
jgi:hypothetical protein